MVIAVPGLARSPRWVIERGVDLAGSAVQQATGLLGALRHDFDLAEAGTERLLAETLEDLGGLAEESIELLSEVIEEGEDLVEDTLGLHRRVWEDPEHHHAQIEARAIDEPGAEGLRRQLKQAVERLDGVQWAEINAITNRVAVAFDETTSPLSTIIGAVESTERAHGIHRRRREPAAVRDWDAPDRADHPADVEPIHRVLAALAGDLIGLGWSVTGRLARLPRLPIEAASVLSLLESNPVIRSQAERLLGRAATDLVVPLANAAAQGVAQGPWGILVDMAYRATLLGELQARREVWQRREPELYTEPSARPIDPPELDPRPVPLPSGPIETWCARLALGSLAGFTATLVATGDPRRAADAFLAGIPKAAHLGREGFAAHLGRSCAARGLLPLDASALRRLDRVNTVVVDSDALVTDRVRLVDTLPLGPLPVSELHAVARRLLDPGDYRARRTDGEWRLEPFNALAEGTTIPRGGVSRARELRAAGVKVLALSRNQQVEGLAAVLHVLEPGAQMLIDTVRRAGHRLVIAGRRGAVHRMLEADAVIPRGKRTGEAIRNLQAEGAVVAALGRRGKTGLAAADVGVGLVRPTGRPPWGADLVCGRELVEAAFLIDATAVAAQVSQRSAQLALIGSALGTVAAVTGPRHGAGRRSLAMVNSAAAVSLAAGVWASVRLHRRAPPAAPERPVRHEPPGLAELLSSDGDHARGPRTPRPEPSAADRGASHGVTVQGGEAPTPVTEPRMEGRTGR